MGIRGGRWLVTAFVCAVAAALPGVAAGAGDPVWVPQGQAVPGADNGVDAPTLKVGSSYTDSVEKGATKAYGVDLDAVSSAYLSAFVLPEPGLTVSYGDGIELRLESADGTLCDRYRANYGSDRAARPLGGYTARTAGVEGRCQEAGRYTLSVVRSVKGDSDVAWPMEIRYVREAGLSVDAVLAPAETYAEQAPTPLAGVAKAASGGVSFDTAKALDTGVWKDRVPAGATRFYKARVDWGQHVEFIAEFAGFSGRQAGDYVSNGIRVESYNPARGEIEDEAEGYRGTQESLAMVTVPVAYENRFSRDDGTAAVRIDGWYYFAVTVHPEISAFADGGGVPATFRVRVAGSVVAGPEYAAGSLAEVGSGSGAAGPGVDTAVGTAVEEVPDPVLRAVGFGGLGTGSALVLWLVGWSAAARRRAA